MANFSEPPAQEDEGERTDQELKADRDELPPVEAAAACPGDGSDIVKDLSHIIKDFSDSEQRVEVFEGTVERHGLEYALPKLGELLTLGPEALLHPSAETHRERLMLAKNVAALEKKLSRRRNINETCKDINGL